MSPLLTLLIVAAFRGCIVNAINCADLANGVHFRNDNADEAGADDFRVLSRYMSGSCYGECIMKRGNSITANDKTQSCQAVGHRLEGAAQPEKTQDCPYRRRMRQHRGYRAVCKGQYTNDHTFNVGHTALNGGYRRTCTDLNGDNHRNYHDDDMCNTECSCVDSQYSAARCIANGVPKDPRITAPTSCGSYDRVFDAGDGKRYRVTHQGFTDANTGYPVTIYVCNDWPYAVGYQRQCRRTITEIPRRSGRGLAREAYDDYYYEDSLYDYDAEIAHLDEEIEALEEELELLRQQK